MTKRLSIGVLFGALGLTAACGSPAGGGKPAEDAGRQDGTQPLSVHVTGCATAAAHPAAPGGYYVNGNSVCTADGRVHRLHGVDRPSLEWTSGGENLSRSDFRLMASWNANVVRIALNQDFWIAESPQFDPSYAGMVDSAVGWAEAEGLDVILDLHWSDRGVLGSCSPVDGCQQEMPDANSITFWTQVATRYRNDGRVMFELYNEPHGVLWSVWKSGGVTSAGWQAVGMQQLYDTVRATGAQNLVLIGGLNWAYDLSGVTANRIDGYNIVYASHPYNSPDRRPSTWDRSWGFLTETDPVILTEFGDPSSATCATDYTAALIQYADAHATNWTAWAWFPGGCSFPAIINDWSGTPSAMGQVVRAALLGYGDPPASPPGEDVPGVTYTFERSSEGWVLNNWHNPDLTNLGAGVPDGGSSPTLRFDEAAGDPSPGALQLTVAFTGTDQYAIADVSFGQHGRNLAGKTLHARVRLVSGSAAGSSVALYACSGGSPSYICPQTPGLDQASLAAGAWMPLTLDLSAATEVGFEPRAILEIGVEVSSAAASPDGGPSDGGGFESTGDLVFEIDNVTD